MSKLYSISTLALKRTGAHPSLVCVCLLIGLGPASAYRPFDGTDAAVADKDKFEIELQPAGLLKDASGKKVFQGEVFNGVDTKVYDVPALPAGGFPST